MIKFILLVLIAFGIPGVWSECVTETTVSGTFAPKEPFCSGSLIFEEKFDHFDHKKWAHEITLGGGGNWEFQWYTNNRSNSYTENGILYLRPTLTSDVTGEAFLTHGTLNVNGDVPTNQCTNAAFWGCERTGTANNILNPIRSARIRTVNSFAFRYGKVEVRAKMPVGDWLWPAIWFMPRYNSYGSWPASGEIDLVEIRGNRNLKMNGVNIGVEQMGSTVHFAPYPEARRMINFLKNLPAGHGYHENFHLYQMEWTSSYIKFSVDNQVIGKVDVGEGLWKRGNFDHTIPHTWNPWRNASVMAPFDQEFYIILNLAVGGKGYFPDGAKNPHPKPWKNHSPTSARDFWNHRNDWLSTWNLDHNLSKDASLQVDYIKVWAI